MVRASCIPSAARGPRAPVVNRDTRIPRPSRTCSPPLHFLHDPAGLPEMERAAARVQRAVGPETILIHGDYDVDGVSGTVLLVRLARTLGAKVEWHIPPHQGRLLLRGPQRRQGQGGRATLGQLDNGTSAVEPISALAEAGVDVIVTDHHEPPDGELPPTHALVNPKLPATTILPRALRKRGRLQARVAVCQRISGSDKVRPDLRAYLLEALGHVAVATIRDVVLLIGENRVLFTSACAPPRRSGAWDAGAARAHGSRRPRPDARGHRLPDRPAHQRQRTHGQRGAAVECMLGRRPGGRRCAEPSSCSTTAPRGRARGAQERPRSGEQAKDDGIPWSAATAGIRASGSWPRACGQVRQASLDRHRRARRGERRARPSTASACSTS